MSNAANAPTLPEAEAPVPVAALVQVVGAAVAVLISFGCLLPIFPVWVEPMAGSRTAVGVATTLAAGVGLVIARPLAARMMEGRARMPTLARGAVLAGIAAALLPWATTFGVVLALRVVQGIGFGLVTTASLSAATDLAPSTRRGQVLGYVGAANAVSMLVGPLLGGAITRAASVEVTFWVAGAICFVPFIWLSRFREPSRAHEVVAGGMLSVLRIRPVRRLVVLHAFPITLHGALIAFLPLHLSANPAWMTIELYFAVDAAMVIGIRLLIGRNFDRFPRWYFVWGGLACLSAAGLLLGLSANPWSVAVAALFYGAGFGLYMPSAHALLGDLVPPAQRARGFAVFLLTFDVSFALGGVAYGPIADAATPGMALFVAAFAPLIGVLVLARGLRA